MGRGEKVYRYLYAAMYLSAFVRIGLLSSVIGLCIINLSDKTTTNQKQYVAVLRHKDALLCPIGANAMVLFHRWHIAKFERPNFATRKDWYGDYLFPGFGGDATKPINPATVGKYINDTFVAVKMMTNTCVHHFWRYYGAALLAQMGVCLTIIELLGGWNQSEFRKVYAINIKPDAGLVGAAGFEAGDIKAYDIKRDAVAPPLELQQLIFPWVDDELEAASARVAASTPANVDTAAVAFLRVLLFFRIVLLQDMAMLHAEYSTRAPIFRHAVFQSPEFLAFKDRVVESVTAADSDASRLAVLASSRQAESNALSGTLAALLAGQAAAAAAVAALTTNLAGFRAEAAASTASLEGRLAIAASAASAGAAAASAAAAAAANVAAALGGSGGGAASASAVAAAAAAASAALSLGFDGGDGTLPLSLASHAQQPPPLALPPPPPQVAVSTRPFVSFEALATVARLYGEWNDGIGGGVALRVHDSATTAQRKAVAEAAQMKPGVSFRMRCSDCFTHTCTQTFKTDLGKRRKIVKEVESHGGGAAGVAVVEQQRLKLAPPTLAKLFSTLSQRDSKRKAEPEADAA